MVPETEDVGVKLAVADPQPEVGVTLFVILGIGLIVIVNVTGALLQLFEVAMAVNCEVIDVVVTGAVYDAMFPVPEDANPIDVFEFVQLKVAPVVELVKFVAATVCPEQTF